jgi:WD40 repeat protein
VAHHEGNPTPFALYDRLTQKKIRDFEKNARIRIPTSIQFTPNGKYVITTDTLSGHPPVGAAWVWEVATGNNKRIIAFGQNQYENGGVVVSDKLVIVPGYDHVAGVYELATGKELAGFAGKQRVRCMAVSRDGAWLLVAGRDKSLTVWDVAKRKQVRTLPWPNREIGAVAISADGLWCAAAPADTFQLRVFSRRTGKEQANTKSFLKTRHLMFSRDGKTLIAAGSGYLQGVSLWDWQSCPVIRGGDPLPKVAQLRRQGENPDMLYHRMANLSGNDILLTLGDEDLRVWDLRPAKSAVPAPKPAPKSENAPARKRPAPPKP